MELVCLVMIMIPLFIFVCRLALITLVILQIEAFECMCIRVYHVCVRVMYVGLCINVQSRYG